MFPSVYEYVLIERHRFFGHGWGWPHTILSKNHVNNCFKKGQLHILPRIRKFSIALPFPAKKAIFTSNIMISLNKLVKETPKFDCK